MTNRSSLKEIIRKDKENSGRKQKLQEILETIFREHFYSLEKNRCDELWFTLDKNLLEVHFFNPKLRIMIDLIQYHFFASDFEYEKRIICDKNKITYLTIPYTVKTEHLYNYIKEHLRFLIDTKII